MFFFLTSPGVVIHELSHWSFAKILMVRTGKISFYRPTRDPYRPGWITLGSLTVYCRDPIRMSLIGLAPLLVGVALLLLLSILLGLNQTLGSQMTPDNTLQMLTSLPGLLIATLNRPINLLWLYLVFVVTSHMFPSMPDRRRWFSGLIVPILFLLALSLVGNLNLPLFWQHSILDILLTLTWLFAFAAVFNLFLALCVTCLEILFKALLGR
ncbi:MAG: hypothetical protein WCS37_06700 [Chloroflexota bacterium]